MTDERPKNLAMISTESETAKTLNRTMLIKLCASLKSRIKSFSYLEIQQMLKSVCSICCVDAVETCFYKYLLFVYINIMC